MGVWEDKLAKDGTEPAQDFIWKW